LASKITVQDARVDWGQPAAIVDRRIRACTPAPGAWSTLDGQRLKIAPVTVVPEHPALPPGQVEVSKGAVHVGTGSSPVRLGEVQPFGKKRMGAADWARGMRLDEKPRLE